jgi:hypothetical protein
LRKLSSLETVEYLLETLREAQEVMGHTSKGPTGDPLPPMMSELWHQGSYRKLEDLLERMAVERQTQFVHVRARYLSATDKVADVKVVRTSKGVHPRLPPYSVARGQVAVSSGDRMGRVAVRVYPPWVRLQKVRLGAQWLADELDQVGGAWLPKEIWESVAS